MKGQPPLQFPATGCTLGAYWSTCNALHVQQRPPPWPVEDSQLQCPSAVQAGCPVKEGRAGVGFIVYLWQVQA